MELRDLIVERVSNTDQGTAVVAQLAPQITARVKTGVKLVATMEVVGVATVATGGLASAGVTAAGGGTLLATTVGGAAGGIGGRAAADAIEGKRSSAADYATAGLVGIGGAYIGVGVDRILDPGEIAGEPEYVSPYAQLEDPANVRIGPTTRAQRKAMLEDPDEARIDHVLPQSKGGTNSYRNLQVLASDENLTKSNRNDF